MNHNRINADDGTRTDIPTLWGVARMVACKEKKILDEKQYIMYEILACTFLFDLICNDDTNGSTALEGYLNIALGDKSCTEMKALIQELQRRGGARAADHVCDRNGRRGKEYRYQGFPEVLLRILQGSFHHVER
jgi:hypothetical protein